MASRKAWRKRAAVALGATRRGYARSVGEATFCASARCFTAFLNNTWFGAAVFAGLGLALGH